MDGRLDEPVWAKAMVGSDFVERTPAPGATPPVATTFRVLYDEDTVYVGVTMGLEPGEIPRAFELQRDDGAIFSDDAISLKFDVRADRRTTAGFVINPAGTQLDYLALENGGDFRNEYDAVWEAEAHVDLEAAVWTAEFRIPVAALGLPSKGTDRIIGLNLSRDHNLRNATYDWSALPPEFGPVAALYYGDLQLPEIAGGSPLALIPYVRGSYEKFDDHGFDFLAGGDVRLRIGEDVWTEVTVLPDFAQTDLDDPVVNFDRFPLFFPERRAFFLTGLQVFDFGASRTAQVFFSRRIGLDEDGNFVRVWGGAKSYGRVGPVQFGLFQVFTGDSEEQPHASWTIARVRNNFGEYGHIGVIGTMQGSLPVEGETFSANLSGGVDGAARLLDRRLELSGFWSGTRNGDVDDSGHAGQVRAAYRGEIVQPRLTVRWVTEDFDPRIGFVSRADILHTELELISIWRYRDQRALREIYLSVAGTTQHSLSTGENVGQRFFSFVNFSWKNGWSVRGWLFPGEEVVEEDFDVFGDQQVLAGRYPGLIGGAEVVSPNVRNPSAGIFYQFNTGFFGGILHSLGVRFRLQLGPHFEFNASADGGLAKREGFEWKRVLSASTRLTVAWTKNISVDVIGQVNSVAETVNGLARLRWRYYPGSDIFLVYREAVDFSEESLVSQRDITLKIQFRFDTVL